MNEDLERQLRDAMNARADSVEPAAEDEALGAIQSRVASTKHRNTLRNRGLIALAAAATIALVFGGIALAQRDTSQHVQVVPPAATTTSALDTTVPPSTTTSTTEPPSTTAPPVVHGDPVIWPLAGSPIVCHSPEDAAVSFGRGYLGMGDPHVVSTAGNHVQIKPSATGGPTTTVVTDQRDGNYVVTGAASDDLVVDRPQQGDALTSPLAVAGQSTAFEATIRVAVRDIRNATEVATTAAMGGANGEMGPFATSLDIPPVNLDAGAVLLVLEPDPSGRGDNLAATVLSLAPTSVTTPASPFVVVTSDGRAVRLDAAGHLQRELTTGANAIAAGGGFIAVSGPDGSAPCGESIRLFTEDGPTGVVIGGSHAALDNFGTLAYVDCSNRPAVREASGFTITYEWMGSPVDGITTIGEGDPIVSAAGSLWQYDHRAPTTAPTNLGPGSLPAVRGRYGSVAYFDGTNILSLLNGVKPTAIRLVTPAAAPVSLDASDAGDTLIWVDTNHDLWTWSGGEPTLVGSGYTAAAL